MTSNEPGDSDKRSPLKIAMVVPPWYELPPRGYGGIELVCAALVDALGARGHDVTVFGAGTRTCASARFVSTYPEPQYPRLGEGMPEALHAARINHLLAQRQFDIVHDHSLCGPLAAGLRLAPTVVTVHGPTDGELADYFSALGHQVHLVAISDSQRRRRPAMNWAATVHNAINPAHFEAAHSPDGPVLWLGRFCAEKGPDLAIEACRAAGVPLVLAGKCNEPAEQRYLDEVVRPMLGSDVELVVNADRTAANQLLTAARALIMSIRWEEPFGMVMIEAMASATPVVALRRGSIPEVIRNGRTGWICDHPAELAAALRRVDELDPAACVAHVRAAFNADLMARRYEQVYRAVIAQTQRSRRYSRGAAIVASTRPLATVGRHAGP